MTGLFRHLGTFLCLGVAPQLALPSRAQTSRAQTSRAQTSRAQTSRAQTVDAQVLALADKLTDETLAYDPTLTYVTGLPAPTNARFADRTPAAIAAFAQQERADLHALQQLNTATLSEATRPTYALLKEQLQSDLQLRVCRTELWDVDHFQGWPAAFPEVAARQAVATPQAEQETLARWSTLPHYIDVDIRNLRSGVTQGYSAPRTVVARVIKQIGELTPTDPAKSPFDSPAARSANPQFQASYRKLLIGTLYPALRRYGTFLRTEYLPEARQGVALADLPNGRACYAAELRANTTLTRTPKEVFALGQQTVAANLGTVREVARKNYGTDDLPTVVAALKARPEEHFHSADDLLAFARTFFARSQRLTADRIFHPLPQQPVTVQPLSALEEAGGGNSRFQAEPDPAKPATFLIQLSIWPKETRAEAEIVTVHETIPGHALQQAVAAQLPSRPRLARLVDNAAYNEGWARYAEFLGEEQGIYDTPDAIILRRLWPARGMVLDPGLHVLGWTRQQAIDYILAAGRDTPASANDLVDRIAVMPGQLTSYDSGGLEILALRREAETQLGPRFNLPAFNRAILDEGSVPLPELRRHLEAWIAAQNKGGAGVPAADR